MKISRNTNNFNSRRRRNPLVLPAVILIVLFAVLIGWFWSRGGPQTQQRVEKPIPAERLGH